MSELIGAWRRCRLCRRRFATYGKTMCLSCYEAYGASVAKKFKPNSTSQEPVNPCGAVGNILYCYGGCGRRYTDFGLDVILPTPLWNRISVGNPFDETQTNIEREGRGGVLCAQCIVDRLAKLPGVTVARMTVDEGQSDHTPAAPVLTGEFQTAANIETATPISIGAAQELDMSWVGPLIAGIKRENGLSSDAPGLVCIRCRKVVQADNAGNWYCDCHDERPKADSTGG